VDIKGKIFVNARAIIERCLKGQKEIVVQWRSKMKFRLLVADDEKNIRDGLAATFWPGRFELMRREPVFIVDSAHNAQGAAQLASNLQEYFPEKKITFIIGVSEDKDRQSIIRPTLPLAKRFIATQANNARAWPATKLADYLREMHPDVYVIPCSMEAAKKALELCDDDEVICSFGSLFHVGTIRDFLLKTK